MKKIRRKIIEKNDRSVIKINLEVEEEIERGGVERRRRAEATICSSSHGNDDDDDDDASILFLFLVMAGCFQII